jgi:hypothetical protein
METETDVEMEMDVEMDMIEINHKFIKKRESQNWFSLFFLLLKKTQNISEKII